MTYVLGQQSRARLKGVHPDLVKVVELAIKKTATDFLVLEGVRTPARQKELYAQGRTKPGQVVTWTLTSNHFAKADGHGHAVDLSPFPVDYEGPAKFPKHDAIAKAMKAAAAELGVKIAWGGDWKTTKDRPHFELVR
jgi:peptidoglycan L-alanyl-D-glutamate endopeptidase CwlK